MSTAVNIFNLAECIYVHVCARVRVAACTKILILPKNLVLRLVRIVCVCMCVCLCVRDKLSLAEFVTHSGVYHREI